MSADTAGYASGFEKFSGLVAETVALLRAWCPGMSSLALADLAIAKNVLGKAASNRVKDVVNQAFAKRFLSPDDSPARYLKLMVEKEVDLSRLREVLFLYTARQQPLMADFMTEVYWPMVAHGVREVDNREARRLITDAFGTPRLPNRWSDSMVQRVAQGMTRALSDFGFLSSRRSGKLDTIPYVISNFAGRFICAEAHFSGTGDTSILRIPEWSWFGLSVSEVPRLLSGLAASGSDFLFQYSGEIARMSWQHKSMEGFLDAQG